MTMQGFSNPDVVWTCLWVLASWGRHVCVDLSVGAGFMGSLSRLRRPVCWLWLHGVLGEH